MTGVWLGLDLFIDQARILVMVMLKETIDLLFPPVDFMDTTTLSSFAQARCF